MTYSRWPRSSGISWWVCPAEAFYARAHEQAPRIVRECGSAFGPDLRIDSYRDAWVPKRAKERTDDEG